MFVKVRYSVMMMKADQSCLVILDVQEKLAPVMHDPRRVIAGCTILLHAAARLNVPVLITEQYPKGLGPTMIDLREMAPQYVTIEKISFSAASEPSFLARLETVGRRQLILAGIETHVCVLQTALELKEKGWDVFVVGDCCSARRAESEAMAHERLRTAGIHLVNREMVLFEWLEKAGTPEFKELQALIR